jgi:hypothetical protein
MHCFGTLYSSSLHHVLFMFFVYLFTYSECLTRVDSMSNMAVVLWEAETSRTSKSNGI